MPAIHDGDVRLLSAFPGSSWDKAFETSVVQLWMRREDRATRPDTRPEELPDDLQPILRYHVRRFAETHLVPGEHVARAEFWYGKASNPSPGSTEPAGTPADRMEILRRYFDGPVEVRVANPVIPPYHAVDHEGDIFWVLEYYEGDALRP